MKDRRDRDRQTCPTCGRTVTVTRSGRLMAHRNDAGRTCVQADARRPRNTPAGGTSAGRILGGGR